MLCIGIGISVLIGSNFLAVALWCKWISSSSNGEQPDNSNEQSQEREYDEYTQQQIQSFEKDISVGLIPAP